MSPRARDVSLPTNISCPLARRRRTATGGEGSNTRRNKGGKSRKLRASRFPSCGTSGAAVRGQKRIETLNNNNIIIAKKKKTMTWKSVVSFFLHPDDFRVLFYGEAKGKIETGNRIGTIFGVSLVCCWLEFKRCCRFHRHHHQPRKERKSASNRGRRRRSPPPPPRLFHPYVFIIIITRQSRASIKPPTVAMCVCVSSDVYRAYTTIYYYYAYA